MKEHAGVEWARFVGHTSLQRLGRSFLDAPRFSWHFSPNEFHASSAACGVWF